MMKKTISRRFMAGLFALVFPLFLLVDPEPVYAGKPYTGDPGFVYAPDSKRVLESDHTIVEKYVNMHFETTANGQLKTSWSEWRIDPSYAEKIWFGEPSLVGCDQCRTYERYSYLPSVRIYLENDRGDEYVTSNGNVLGKQSLDYSGLNFSNLPGPIRVGLELCQNPRNTCSYCGRLVGDTITVDGLYWQVKTISFISQPASQYVTEGSNATFSFALGRYVDADNNPLSYYRWQKNITGTWEYISDGTGTYGESYSGSSGSTLNIRNARSQMRGMMLRCELRDGVGGYVYTDTVYLNMPAPTAAPVTPTPAPATPTPAPATPTDPPPTASPTPTRVPTPVPITPSPGSGRTDYTPSSSSSSYVPSGSSSTSSGGGKTSSSSSSSTGSGRSSYSGTITETGGSSASTKILAQGPAGGGTSAGRSSSSGRGSTTGGRNTAGSASGSSSFVSKSAGGGNYVMKNGVLYVIDDDDTIVSAEDPQDQTERVENEETELAYQASDLAATGEIKEQEQRKGFFSTIPGYLTIAGISLLLLLALLFFLFFGVIVLGEVEEHDEVFEVCALRLMLRRDGKWYVKLGTAFDDNAVLKLRIGLLFAKIFEEWDITGQVTGSYEGVIGGRVEQGMLLYRRNIRRTV